MKRALLLMLAGLVLAGPALADDDDDGPAKAAAATPASADGSVTLDVATQARLGIATVKLTAARATPASGQGVVKVVDPASLVQTDGDIAAAEAALVASRTEATRSARLAAENQSVATREVEANAAVARADQAKLTLLQRQLTLAWGPAIGGLSDAGRGALVDQLASGKAALVRIDSLGGAGQRTSGAVSIAFQGLGEGSAAILGPARSADATLVSPGMLAKVTGPLAARLSVGLNGTAALGGGGAQSGVLLPRSALVRQNGAAFAYVQTAPNAFQQRAVNAPVFRTDGVFVADGFQPGDAVVVSGAGAIAAAQAGAPDSGDDD